MQSVVAHCVPFVHPSVLGVAARASWRPGSIQPQCNSLSREPSRSNTQRPVFRSLKLLQSSGPLCGAALLLILPLPAAPQLSVNPSHSPSPRPSQAAAPGTYTITPERRALLDTIRYAEGTWKGGRPEGYRVLYGGGLFSNLSHHPEITVHRRYTSAAAGAYQFLPATWREAARKLALRDFSAPNQDQAALFLVERRGALAAVDRSGLGGTVLAQLSREWASLPTRHGVSHYGQPVKSRQELIAFYATALLRARQQFG